MEVVSKTWQQVPDKKCVHKLYRSAFPREERLPWWLLRLLSRRSGIGLTGYYSDGAFRGFTFTAETQEVLFVLFFAVEEAQRGSGWGSRILEKLKQEHPHQAIVLNVEPLDDAADNAEQRLSRMRFYSRNGFYDTGYDIDEVGGTFRVLSSKQQLDVDAYLQIFRKISFGFWKPEIRKIVE
mgnify:FL=1|jgi:GNAT superfamily N-acetyltransferase